MEIKDSSSRVLEAIPIAAVRSTQGAKDLNSTTQDRVSIDRARDERTESVTQLRAQINDAIGALNLAGEATQEIDKLAISIDGILTQASKDDLSPQRREALARETNELVQAIKNQAQVTTESGVKPLAGDRIQLQVEAELGRTLDILLPDDAKQAFGIGTVSFSKGEAILQTRATVAAARNRIESLQRAVDESKQAVSATVDVIEVALQNSEASRSTLRDVDKALQTAADAGALISGDPLTAINSFGKIRNSVTTLLR